MREPRGDERVAGAEGGWQTCCRWAGGPRAEGGYCVRKGGGVAEELGMREPRLLSARLVLLVGSLIATSTVVRGAEQEPADGTSPDLCGPDVPSLLPSVLPTLPFSAAWWR